MKNQHSSWYHWIYNPFEKRIRNIHAAVKNKNVDEIISLKESGADFSVKSKDGRNLMHHLAQERWNNDGKDEEIFDLLISEHCFDVNATDINGKSALHVAAESDNRGVAYKLIEYGVDVNCTDNKIWTPLHYAVLKNKIVLVDFLLSRKANVNAKDHEGIRPIHLVHSETVLDLLVRYRAYIGAPDRKGQTALAKAISKGHDDFVKLLLTYGADITTDTAVLSMIDDFDKNVKKYPALWIALYHMMKLMAVGLPCPKKSIVSGGLDKSMPEILKLFGNEIRYLKSTRIDGRCTIYEFLHMDVDKRYSLAKIPWKKWNFNILCAPELLFVVVACRLRSLTRRWWLNLARDAWLDVTNISLPDICVEAILSNLSDLDLINIIDGDEDRTD